MQVRKRNQLGEGGKGSKSREKTKFLLAQHNEEMIGHGFAPYLLEKPDLKYMLSDMYEVHFVEQTDFEERDFILKSI